MKVKSDPALLSEVREFGKFDTNACLQCGSCTVICDLANGTSFPRKPIRHVLLGLKKLAVESLEPWICHDCGDCSETCPRQTEPREAMMTLRRYLIAQYDWTGLSAKISLSKAWHVTTLSFVGVLTLLLALFYHLYIAELELGDLTEPMGMEHMFGIIKYFTAAVIFIPFFFLLSHAIRMWWLTMHRRSSVKVPFSLYLREIKTYIVHSVTHKKIRECPEEKRWSLHWLLASGCVLMLVIKAFFLGWFQTDEIYPLYHPQRWLGYFAAAALILATGQILIGRIRKHEEIHKFSERSDWTLPILLLLTAVSGIAVHLFRYAGFELTCHFTYALHLAIAVPLLVVEMPFGKLSHMLYRPLALYFQSVKKRALQEESIKELIREPVLEHAEQ